MTGHVTQTVFETLETSWLPQNCTLTAIQIEFGVDVTTNEIVLAEVIENDSRDTNHQEIRATRNRVTSRK